MSALAYSPQGLQWVRNKQSTAANFAVQTTYYIAQGYASAIAFGDLVYTQSSGNQGYIAPYAEAGTRVLGVFLGCQPYFDTVQKQTIDKQYWAGTESASGDVAVWVADDPFDIFLCQCNGGPITTANRGQNIDFGGGGAPNGQGLSVGYLDFATVANTSTLPLRIVGWSTKAFPGYDPTVATSQNQPTYNYAEVTLNPGACESLIGTGY
jgi:hypothetical protein